MQDLSRDPQTGGRAYLVPSSMSAGNTIKNMDTAGIEMTAPGSVSVLTPQSPTTDKVIRIPEPTDEKIPLPFAGTHGDAGKPQPPDPGRDGAMNWTDMHDVPEASRWRQTR